MSTRSRTMSASMKPSGEPSAANTCEFSPLSSGFSVSIDGASAMTV